MKNMYNSLTNNTIEGIISIIEANFPEMKGMFSVSIDEKNIMINVENYLQSLHSVKGSIFSKDFNRVSKNFRNAFSEYKQCMTGMGMVIIQK